MRGPPGADEPEIAAAAERVGVTPVAAMPGWGALLDHDQMRRKIHKRSNVSRTESTNEPRQPSRLEKKRNTHAGCPTGHGPTRGVSGVSDSTTLFHMLAQSDHRAPALPERGVPLDHHPGREIRGIQQRRATSCVPRASHDGEAGRVQAMRASRSLRCSPCCRLWVNTVVSNQVGKAFARRLGPRKRA